MLIRKLTFLLIAIVAMGVAAPAPPSVSTDARDIIAFLDQTVEWRRQMITSASVIDIPGELIYTANTQSVADQTAVFAFQFARSVSPQVSNADATANSSGTDVAKLQKTAQDRVASVQSEIDALDQTPVKTKADRDAREVKRQELQSELAFSQARLDTVNMYSAFIRQTITKSTGARTFSEQIDQLARSSGIPLAPSKSKNATDGQTSNPTQQAATVQAQATGARQQSTGIVGMIEESVALSRKSHDIERLINSTQSLQTTIRQLRDPLLTELRNTVQQGDAVEQAADNADLSTLADEAKKLDQYTTRFRALSTAILPIGEQALLLDQQLQNLNQWQSFVRATNVQVVRRIGVQASVVGIIIVVILGFAEIWKRATFRYVHDLRRRTQFLLLRRIVLGLVITFIVAFALVTQAGSLATYAGFLTAGLAVALQNVILSIVAYFFLIGRYGLHVGDRITINGVSGDVFDIGLVRLHLLEISGIDTDQHATGRSVVFSNSVILQPGTSLFKQLPGSDFVWHEVRLTMSPNSDVERIEKQLLASVEAIFKTYSDSLRRGDLSTGLRLRLEDPRPNTRLRLTESGLEVVIRYPVPIAASARIDDQVARTLLAAIEQEPDVRLVPVTAPALQYIEHPPASPPPAVK